MTNPKLAAARQWALRGSQAVPGVIWTVRDTKGVVSRHYERKQWK